MLDALLVFAAETAHSEEGSKALFYIVGLIFTGWALLVSALGMSRKREWPGSDGAAKGVMGISVLLMAATMASAIIAS